MYDRYTLAIIRFSLVSTSDPKYNFTFFHLSGKQEQLRINIYCKISSVNGIHTEEVDLLEFEKLNILPSWYPIFGIPYTIQANIDYTPHTAVINLLSLTSLKTQTFSTLHLSILNGKTFLHTHTTTTTMTA